MADINKLKPFLLKWEGGYVNDPHDRGGATNKGVTIATFRQFYGQSKTTYDLRHMTDAQWTHILEAYWNPWKANQINNQSIANILVDFGWASGIGNAIKRIQRAFGLTPDGIVGNHTLSILNGADSLAVFSKIKQTRLSYVQSICEKNTTQVRFLRGWQNRINDIQYEKD